MDYPSLRSAGRGLALMLLGLYGAPSVALQADEAADRSAYRDLQHTILARQALLKDNTLAALNLGVKVHNRVAVLWGPVPSAGLREQAVRVLRSLRDLLEVRDEMHIEESDEPPPRFLPDAHAPLLPRLPRPQAEPNQPGFSRDLLTRRPTDPALPTSAADNVHFKPAPPRSAAAEWENTPEAVLPSIQVGVPGASAPGSLEAAVGQLRFADYRFQGLHIEVRGGEVRLTGAVARGEDLQDFAGRVARLPGVERVVLDQVRTNGP